MKDSSPASDMTGLDCSTASVPQGFDGLARVIAQPVTFKTRLGVGEDAFTSLRSGRRLVELWQVATGAAMGGAAASSSVVATTFFATTPTTLLGSTLAALGFGTAAVTPIGWVLGAAAATGGLSWGVQRLWRTYGASRVDSVPRFINAPVDVLGVSIFDLMGGLSVLVVRQAGELDDDERGVIGDYFVEEWGFDADYVAAALPLLEDGVNERSIEDAARTLGEFVRSSPDCNHRAIGDALRAFLNEVVEADGCVDEAEREAIARIDAVFSDANRSRLDRALDQTVVTVESMAEVTASGIESSYDAARMSMESFAETAASKMIAFSEDAAVRIEQAREQLAGTATEAKRTLSAQKEWLLHMVASAQRLKDESGERVLDLVRGIPPVESKDKTGPDAG